MACCMILRQIVVGNDKNGGLGTSLRAARPLATAVGDAFRYSTHFIAINPSDKYPLNGWRP